MQTFLIGQSSINHNFMEKVYTSYSKKVQGITFYFVKKFIVFPEHENIPPIQESYGMHTIFEQACKIASVNESMRECLPEDVSGNRQYAKVIDFKKAGLLRQKTC